MKLTTSIGGLNIVKIFIRLTPLIFVLTIMAALVYVVGHHNFRMNANDPQIQLAEDLTQQLAAGRTVASLNITNNVDMAKSLSLFILIYDSTGKVVAGSGKLNDQYPILPVGVLDYAREAGQNRITWEPQSGLRFALVAMPYGGSQPGFVVIGRSLREVEQRISMMGWWVLSVWLVGLVGLFGLTIGRQILFSRVSRASS